MVFEIIRRGVGRRKSLSSSLFIHDFDYTMSSGTLGCNIALIESILLPS